MAERILTQRELNRALLARHMLLERTALPAPAAIERLAGLQAQQPLSPYVALWTRLRGFRRDDLAGPIGERSVVKATLMRTTLHLVTAEDYLWLRPTIHPALARASRGTSERRGQTFDLEHVLAEARRFIGETPRSFAELSAFLVELQPAADVAAMRFAVRMHLPMVQVPIADGWSYPGNPKFTLAEPWLGRPIPTEQNVRALLARYLAAFGPASVADLQAWSGLSGLKGAIEELRGELRTFRDERGRELLDLPNAPLPPGDTPAPERFLPEYDNLYLAHQDRTRIISEADRARAMEGGNLRFLGTFLVDGFGCGVWRIEKTKAGATLAIEPFRALTQANRRALTEEGEQLLRFVESGAQAYTVRFQEPS